MPTTITDQWGFWPTGRIGFTLLLRPSDIRKIDLYKGISLMARVVLGTVQRSAQDSRRAGTPRRSRLDAEAGRPTRTEVHPGQPTHLHILQGPVTGLGRIGPTVTPVPCSGRPALSGPDPTATPAPHSGRPIESMRPLPDCGSSALFRQGHQ